MFVWAGRVGRRNVINLCTSFSSIRSEHARTTKILIPRYQRTSSSAIPITSTGGQRTIRRVPEDRSRRVRRHHPAPALFLRNACVLPRAVLALTPALRRCSTLHCDGALFCGVPALYIGLRGRSMQAPALFPALRSSFPSFAALFPTLCRTWARQGRSRLILLVAGLLVGETHCGAGYGARCHNQTIVWYSRSRHIKFLALH